jgi:MFS transporter, DHA1 family, inner membrane transport protein
MMSNPKMIAVLAFSCFTGITALLLMNSFLPVIAEDFGTSVAVLGQINTATFILGAAIALILGPLADHVGLRRTIVAVAILIGVSGFATAMATGYWTLLLSRIPAGFGVLGAIAIAIASAHLPAEERRKGIGWVISATPLSAILGLPVFTLIAYYSSWRMAFVALGLALWLTAWLLWRFVPADPPISDERFRLSSVLRAYHPLLSYPPSVFLYIADILRGLTWFGILVYLSSFFINELGLTLQDYAGFMVVAGIAYFLGTRFGDGVIRRVSLGMLFYGATAVMAVSAAIAFVNPFPIPGILVLILIYAFMGGVTFPAMAILISETSRAGQGTTMVLRQSGMNVSQAGGAALGGALLVAGGYSMLGLGLAGFGLLSIVAVTLSTRATTVEMPAETATGTD